MKRGLVLGAGGVVGMAYNAGVLKGLEDAGLDPASAEVIVGTSAGAVVGAYLRSGWTVDDFWHLAHGTHPLYPPMGTRVDRDHSIIAPAFRTPLGLMRRSLGAAFVMGRSVVRAPSPQLPGLLRRAFPGALFAMPEGQRRFSEELPEAWPDGELDLCAFDITRGRRVVLRRDGKLHATFRQAVTASCAIPGVYAPVAVGRATLVDGGVFSTTNLDVAVAAGCTQVTVAAPMAYDPQQPPSAVSQLVRQLPSLALAREVAAARKQGVEVLVIRPSAAEVRLHGMNLMDADRADEVAEAARASVEGFVAKHRPAA
jgi:NTE family protein